MLYGAAPLPAQMASAVLKLRVAGQATGTDIPASPDGDVAPRYSGILYKHVCACCRGNGTENSCCPGFYFRVRKESSNYESRFFSHCTGSKHGGVGRLRQQKLCQATDHATH